MSAARAAARFAAKARDEVVIDYIQWDDGWTETGANGKRTGTSAPMQVTVTGRLHSPDYASGREMHFGQFQQGDLIVDLPPAGIAFLDSPNLTGVRFTIAGARYVLRKLPEQMQRAADVVADGVAISRTLLLTLDRGAAEAR